ncbi:MAG: CHAT domain-containing protein [Rhodoferax sp.]|jgi:CHAT domain-containing protein|nr:CHAT domain-containing protein [Rhodoferax sp.]
MNNSFWNHLRRGMLVLMLVLSGTAAVADVPSQLESALARGVQLRQLGQLDLSIDVLTQATALPATDQQRMRLFGELGASLRQARRLDPAATALKAAYGAASGAQRAVYALELGHLSVLLKQPEESRRYYTEAQQLAGHDFVRLGAALSLARMMPGPDSLHRLQLLLDDIGKSRGTDTERAALYLNLGHQAQALGEAGLALVYQSLAQARKLSEPGAPSRLQIEALDAMAQLYETQRHHAEALALTRQALELLAPMPASAVGDLLLALESRQGRLYTLQGQPGRALAAYQRATDQLELQRLDIPIEHDDGSSSFRQTFEPIYLGLLDALLTAADNSADADARASYLRRALDAAELLKQSEMQDYLGDRCTVDTVKGGTATVIAPQTAVLYPIILADRVELLLQTQSGIARFGSRVAGPLVRSVANSLAKDLRNGGVNFIGRSRQLYDWLLRPLEPFMAANQITTLVLVPDGALRLVPLGALHDGQQFAIEKFAISTVTGLSMTNTTAPSAKNPVALVAGAGQFGPVVDKLMQTKLGQNLVAEVTRQSRGEGQAASRMLRSPVLPMSTESVQTPATLVRSLREALALPGVAKEVEAVSRILPGTRLFDAGFTLDAFRDATGSGAFKIVHVASHGMFGGSADASYVLAYDDFLTLDGLQALLKADQFRKQPIELLSLSACETAEGNDRAPLGISGAAIKARAKSVLGTLWPVDDEAAVRVMTQFYGGLTQSHLSKAQALRAAQVELIQTKEFAHPFFWAPFVLIGNWL